MASYEERKGIITKLQEKRKSSLITYFTLTDRANAPTLFVADDAIRPFHQLLQKTESDNVDLFIYTRGGQMMSAYTIVKMFRSCSKRFNVIVPFRCHSAGTQIALGADTIVMGKIGQLSPVDPSTTNIFNPLLNPMGNPADPTNRKAISVEDVQSYFNLAKDRLGLLGESDRLEVFKELTKSYEPLALGNVNRVYNETREIAKEVLFLHMDKEKDEERIGKIVKALTETYTHDFTITRDMAENIGLDIKKPDIEEEKLIMDLYESYETELNMNIPFDAETFLQSRQTPVQTTVPQVPNMPQIVPQNLTPQPFQLKLGAIESLHDSFMYIGGGSVYPALSQVNPQMLFQPGMYPPNPVVKFKFGAWKVSTKVSGSFE